MSKYENGDVDIQRVTMFNKNIGAGLSIKAQMMGFDIYEDVTKPTMFALFHMYDAIGLLESFPIIGEETITVEYGTPGLTTSKYSFRCFEITNVNEAPNRRGKYYTLRCVSEEHLLNGTNIVAQAYNGLVSDTVSGILASYLNTKKAIMVDQTKGIQKLVFPKLSPLEAIDFCRRRSVSKQYASSSYVFFENQNGFVFKTVEGLIEQGKKKIGSRVFNFINTSTVNPEAQRLSWRTALNYEIMARTDSVQSIDSGAYYAVTNSFDITQKKLTTTTFKLNQQFDKLETTNKKDQIPNSSDFINKYANSMPYRFFIPTDSSRPEQFLNDMLPIRNAYSILLNQNITRILANGDSGLSAGDVVQLNFPTQSGYTSKKEQNQEVSGNYFVLRIRHLVTNSMKSKHEIVFDCVKLGVKV
jgi:hypothetical protein